MILSLSSLINKYNSAGESFTIYLTISFLVGVPVRLLYSPLSSSTSATVSSHVAMDYGTAGAAAAAFTRAALLVNAIPDRQVL